MTIKKVLENFGNGLSKTKISPEDTQIIINISNKDYVEIEDELQSLCELQSFPIIENTGNRFIANIADFIFTINTKINCCSCGREIAENEGRLEHKVTHEKICTECAKKNNLLP